MDSHRKNLIFLILCVTCVALALLSTALNTALPAMASDLGVSSATCQWVISGYALSMAIAMPCTAFLVTRFPTRRLYLCALGVYLACTVVCALVGSFAAVMVARVVQAAANGLISSLTQVTILSVFGKGERGSRMGWFGLSTGVAPVIAPTLGGMVVDAWGWRAIFWIIAALLLVSLVASLIAMKDALQTAPKHFDVPSFAMSIFAFGGVTLGLGAIPSSGIGAPNAWLPLVVGVVASVFFVRRQLVLGEPFLQVQLLASRDFSLSVVGSAALYFAMMGSAAALPVFLQGSLGCSASVAGLAVLPGAACMALVNPVAGKIFDRLGIGVLSLVSGIVLVASNGLMCVPLFNQSLVAVVVLTVLRYVAIGCVQMPLMTWGNTVIDSASMAHGTALLTSLRNIAGAIGVAVCIGLLDALGVSAAYCCMAVASLLVLPLATKMKQST